MPNAFRAERTSAPLLEFEWSRANKKAQTTIRITVGSSIVIGLLSIIAIEIPVASKVVLATERLLRLLC
jgi:hypothetical protein